MITNNVSKRRTIPLSVETNEPWSALTADGKNVGDESPTTVMSGGFARYGGRAPPPPKSPLHGARRAAASEAQAPSRGGADKMLLLRQMNVTSSAGYQTAHTGGALHDPAHPGQLLPLTQPQAPAPAAVVAAPVPELSAAQIHKERKLAESKRRQEVQLMIQEDYIGKPEGQERLSRQEERTQMAEEELRMARIVEAEKAHLRAQQLQQQREEEARIRDMYLTKLRLEREEKERVAKEKEIARKQVLEEKMKALKEAADAKAREDYAARQRRIEEEALIEREQRISEMEIARLAVEDELAGAMRQEYLAEVERKQQIAAEEVQWKQFETAEAQKQLEATLKRRAAQAEQYEQDKQRRMEIHRLQKERARLVERKHKQTHEEAVSEVRQVERGGSQRSLLDNITVSSAHEGKKSKEDILTIGGKSPRSEATPIDNIDLSHNEEESSTENVASSIDDGCESKPKEKDDATATPPLDKAKGSNDGEVARPDLSAAEPCEEVDEQTEASECQQESQAAEMARNDIPEPGELKHKQITISILQDEANKVPLSRERSPVKEEEPNAGVEFCEPAREDQDEEVGEHQQNLHDDPTTKAAEARDSNGEKEDEPLLNDDEDSSSDNDNSLQPTENEAGCPVLDHVEASTTPDSHEGEAPSTLPDQQQPRLLSVRDARAYGLDPFAQVLHVKDNSPAMEAALKAGDLLVDFGGITSKTPNCLLLMAEKVKSFVNQDIELLVLRPEDSTLSIGENEEGGKFTRESLSLRPRKWKGKGLLGCQLNPFKWVEEQDPEPERTGDLANHDVVADDEHTRDGGSANLLVFYNVASGSIADQIGIKNGDLLMKCGEMGFANDLAAVAEYFQAVKPEQISIELEIQRWIPEDQQYQQLVLVLPASICDPLGCSMTTFTEYYNISDASAVGTDAAATLSACMDCYYTTLATAVHAAALNGHVTCLEALYEASRQEENADTEDQKSSSNSVLDWRDGDGRSPLFYACYAQQVESVKFLLAHMAHDEVFDPLTGGDLYGDSPLHAATLSESTEILILLLESKYITVDVVNATQLACAHVAPNYNVLELLGERFSADLLAADSDGRMPLSHACLRNDLESVAYLCEKHPDFVDYADASGNTPLHLSAWLGYLDVIKVLVKYLPAIAMYMPNQDDLNPLEIAQASGYDETAQFLEDCMAASNQDNEEKAVSFQQTSGEKWFRLLFLVQEERMRLKCLDCCADLRSQLLPVDAEIGIAWSTAMASGGDASRIKRSGGDHSSSHVYGNGSRAKENDFMKYISIDFSSLESRFAQVFEKLEALETRMDLSPGVAGFNGSSSQSLPSTADESTHVNHSNTSARSEGGATEGSESTSGNSSNGKHVDLSGLAKEIESLRAAQLRLKIDQEVAQSTLRVDMDTLRRDLELISQHSDLSSFRAEINMLIANNVKALQAEQSHLEHNMNLTLSERELAENKWKSVFEDTIAARIQDLWSGMHSTSRKLQENMQFLQTDMIKQEEMTREMSDAVEQMKKKTSVLERDTLEHATILGDHVKGIAQLFAMSAQGEAKMAAQEVATASHVAELTGRIESEESRLLATQKKQNAFAEEVDTTLKNVCVDLVSCQSTLQAHQDNLHLLDAGIMRQSAELMHMNDQLIRSDAKLGGIDGRVAIGEKKTGTIATVIQEHYQEMQHYVNQINASLDQASSERGAMKRVSGDLNYSIQETQQKLNEVGKLVTTTDLALTRTAAEIPKLHVLVTTNSSNVAKNRQTIRDLNAMIDEEKLFSQGLRNRFDKEIVNSEIRFAEVAKKDEATQEAIQDAANTTQNIKHTLEEAIRHNSNMIHQLNTMVDSIAITESSEDMEDKLSRFALSVAEHGLKLEHFGKNAPSASNLNVVKEDVKSELAMLLTKVIRFLGSGVSIDQNKYLLTAKRQQYVEPSTGAIIMEMPPQQVLDNLRLAKASIFCAKTRMYMDQLQPVLLTNKHAIEFRDSFERKLKFVIEFGLANLFPNLGKPKNPQNKRSGNYGTCIACDRPIDDEQLEQTAQQHINCGDPAVTSRPSSDIHRDTRGFSGGPEHDDSRVTSSANFFLDDLVAVEHRLRRQRIASSAGSSVAANRIDTKSVVRGRSGNSGLRPKSSAEPVHHAPGSADFIYRAGFRLPKSASGSCSQQQGSTSSKSASAAALLFSGMIANGQAAMDPSDPDDHNASSSSLIDSGSSLEKVGLTGKCQPVEIPSAIGGLVSPYATPRPHTAPYRTKSLPRLESHSNVAQAAALGDT